MANAVTVVAPERMNLLGLIMRSILERRLAEPAALRSVQQLLGDIAIDAGGMTVTLRFTGEGVRITRDPPMGRPLARVSGSMRALIDASIGRGMVRSVLSRDLRVSGNPLALLRLILLLRV